MTVRDWRVRCTTSLPALPHAFVIFVDATAVLVPFLWYRSVPKRPPTVAGLYALLAAAIAAAAAFEDQHLLAPLCLLRDSRVGSDEEGYTITESFVTAMLERFREEKKIHTRFAFEIVMGALRIFQQLPTLVDVDIPSGVSCSGEPLLVNTSKRCDFFGMASTYALVSNYQDVCIPGPCWCQAVETSIRFSHCNSP